MKNQDAVTAIFWVILGSVISVWSATFPFGTKEALGPAILPFGSGLILISLGSILFFESRKQNEVKTTETFVPLIPRGAAFTRTALSLGSMFLSAVLLESLGFVLTVFCLILFLMRAIHPQKWRVSIFYSLVFTLGSYIVFQVLLKTTLPRGFIGF